MNSEKKNKMQATKLQIKTDAATPLIATLPLIIMFCVILSGECLAGESITAAVDQKLLSLIDEYAPTYYRSTWNMNIEEFKAWVAIIAWGEGGKGGYGAHSQGNPGTDLFAHKDYPSFRFSTGIGPFQLDRGGYGGWGTWPTLKKLDAAQAVQTVMEQHYTQFPNAGATLQSFANASKWNAVLPGNVEALWSEVTGTTWSQYSSGNVSLSWSTIETTLAGNANDASLYPYSQNVQDVGMKTWNIAASAGLYTDSGKRIIFTGAHDTWYITARTWGGTKLFQYYYTYDSSSDIEVWVLDNATASQNSLCYIFERECNGPCPERYLLNPGDTLSAPALVLGTDTTPPTISAFSVSPASITIGTPVTISYTAADTGGSGLKTAQLWRAPDDGYGVPGTWQQVGSSIDISAGGNGPFQGSFSNLPPLVGKWWYGVHVNDGASPSNWNDERNSQTSGLPGVFGPIQVTLSVAVNQPPWTVTVASASPNPVTATATCLSVLGGDDGGEGNLTYTWATMGIPPAPVSFSVNGNNNAKSTTATFVKAGDYDFMVTITDSGGLSILSSVSVTVNQTLTTIVVGPATTTLNLGGTQQFTATGHDQFGNLLVQQPSFTWMTTQGSISTSGLLTAPNTSANVTVTATSGTVNGVAAVTVNSQVIGDFSWQCQANMPQALSTSLGAVLDGKIHVVGGNIGNAHYCYDPSANAWSTPASTPSPISDGGAAVVNSKLYAIGYFGTTSVTEIYDPASNTWSTGATMPTPRDYSTVVESGGKVYAIGGWDSGGNRVGTVEVYDPVANTWASRTAMPTPRAMAASVSLGGLIYVIGGNDPNYGSTSTAWKIVEVYNPATDTWTSKSPMSTRRAAAVTVVVGGKIIMIGGFDGFHDLASVEAYDPSANSWHTLPSSLLTAQGSAVAGVVNGNPYVIGGDGPLSTVEKGTALYQTIPTITWATPASITYGTALSGTQLNAQASVGGTYAYSWNVGDVPNAGWHTLSVTFTPDDTTDYTTATATVWLWVNQATPTISWAVPAAITYGTALDSTQLNATTSWSVGGTLGTVAGTFAYAQPTGTVLDPGNKTLSVTFTPSDMGDFTTATASVPIMVNPVNIVFVTVQPNPSGSSFTVDGTTYTAAQPFSWISGSSHTIATSSPQSGGTGIQYVWSNWNDSGAMSHSVAPTDDTTYTANFTTQYYLTMNAGTGGSVTPASGWYNSGTPVAINAITTDGYSFSCWSGSGLGQYSGNSSSASVTMNGPITETASFGRYLNVQVPGTTFGVRTNQFGFTITGTSNLVVVVEACTNLANPVWQPIKTNTLTGGSCYFNDPAWTNYPGRFYRLRSP